MLNLSNLIDSMKKLIIASLLICGSISSVYAVLPQKAVVNVATSQASEKVAEIKFDSLTHDFGKFSADDPIVKCTFRFTNTGDAPLIIHQAISSCGCTVPAYTKDPIKPGESGTIDVTYNGRGKFAGRFKKSITIRSNANESPVVRLTIEGDMQEGSETEKD